MDEDNDNDATDPKLISSYMRSCKRPLISEGS